MPTNINAKVNGKVRTRQDKQNKQQPNRSNKHYKL